MIRSTILITCFAFATPVFSATDTALTDGQRAQILMTVNQGEIEAAKLAESKAKNKEVKSFAKMMRKQHEQNLKDTEKLAKKMGWETAESDTSQRLATDAKNDNGKLSYTDEGGFDKDYMGAQMKAHSGALQLLDTDLIPNAQDPALKKHFMKTRDAVAAHLEHAKKVDQKL